MCQEVVSEGILLSLKHAQNNSFQRISGNKFTFLSDILIKL